MDGQLLHTATSSESLNRSTGVVAFTSDGKIDFMQYNAGLVGSWCKTYKAAISSGPLLILDGGGSSTIWTSAAGVLNHPCDNSKWDHDGCRKVPTVIIAK